MTWGNNSVFQILIIQGSQAVTGLFLYNGLGAPGNPPQFAAVASTVTQDPFGNAITSSKILIQGNVITESGGIFRTAAAAPLIQLDGPHNAYLQFNAAAQLTETIAPVLTSDGLGDTVQAGFTTYVPGTPTTFGQLFQGQLVFGHSGTTVTPAIGGSGINMVFSSGQDATHVIQAGLALISATSGNVATAQLGASQDTALELTNTSVTPASVAGGPLAFGSGGQLRVVDGADGNNYTTQRLTLVTTGSQNITSTTPATVTGLSKAVSSGRTYRVSGRVSGLIGGTNTTIKVQIQGPAISSMEVGYWFAQNNPGGATLFTATQTAIGTLAQPTTVNQGAGSGFTLLFDGIVNFSAAGTASFQAAEAVAGQTWQTNANSYMNLEPV